MHKLKTVFAICLLIAVVSCKDEQHEPLSKDGPAPAPVTNAKVAAPLPGGAKLTYQLPDDKNVLYVKAVYESPRGNFREVKSSLYSTSLVIDGLGTTEEYDVQLFTVNRANKQSEPVALKVTPMTPPVMSAFASLQLAADFGGIVIDFQNPDAGNIIITLMMKDELGDWADVERYYTANKQGQISATGLPAGSRTYGVFVKDRWDNHSDTLETTLAPLAEKELDKALFAEHLMGTWTGSGVNTRPLAPGSDWAAWYQNNARTRLSAAWDGVIPTNTHLGTYNAAGMSPLPISVTMDLGVQIKLSRLIYNARIDNATVIWSHGGMQDFEIWGTTAEKMVDKTDPSFTSNGWEKLLDCRVVKPSGLTPNSAGNYTSEDLALITKGFEFRFPLNTPEVRYIRIRILKNFLSLADPHIAELTFFGQDL